MVTPFGTVFDIGFLHYHNAARCNAFGYFRRVVVWLGVVVSTEWKKADFDQFRALYCYQWCGVCICGGYGEEREGMGGKGRRNTLTGCYYLI